MLYYLACVLQILGLFLDCFPFTFHESYEIMLESVALISLKIIWKIIIKIHLNKCNLILLQKGIVNEACYLFREM